MNDKTFRSHCLIPLVVFIFLSSSGCTAGLRTIDSGVFFKLNRLAPEPFLSERYFQANKKRNLIRIRVENSARDAEDKDL